MAQDKYSILLSNYAVEEYKLDLLWTVCLLVVLKG